jgi:hypothetical protein
LFESALITILIGAGILGGPVRTYHVEREPVADGAELVTMFGRLHDAASGSPDLDVPLFSVLRDSLGDSDPANDRLRYVWILTRTRPTLWQRAASAMSFAYFPAGSQRRTQHVPAPTLDLASPAKSVWTNLLGDGLQSMRLDPMGALIRSTTRTYRSNSSDYRKLQVFQALSALGDFERGPAAENVLPETEMREIYSRLSLSNRTFGGLVQQRNLPTYYDQQTSRLQEIRGHNWELLRQRAELCDLYFDPLAPPDGAPSEALLWIAREDLAERQDRRYDAKFLGIANPWTDVRLLHWTGYTEVRYFDSDNRPAPPDTPGVQAREMIPLAFYSLDYPRVPLLLADFRDSLKPKRREWIQQGASGVLTGVVRVTRFGNLAFLAANSGVAFVRRRRGAANNRTARLQAYSEAREFLAVDSGLAVNLKAELLNRLEHLALNPLENGIPAEAEVARQQHAALLAYAGSPRGITIQLERDRRKELESYTRPRAMRLLAGVGRLFTRGPRVDPEHPDPQLRAQLDSHRRANNQCRFLNQLLASSPRPDVVWDTDAIRVSVDALSSERAAGPLTPRLIAQVFEHSLNGDVRAACLRALERLNTLAARNALRRLSQEPQVNAGVGDAIVDRGE